MRFFRTRTALVVGAIALAIAVGAAGVFATQRPGAVFAQAGETELDGIVELLPETAPLGNWQVSGRTVTVNEQTEIDLEGQTLAAGLRVEVEGVEQPDGTILASEVEVREADDDDGGPADPAASAASQDDDDGASAAGPGDDDDGGPAAPGGAQPADDDD